jgi:hypothetical protein
MQKTIRTSRDNDVTGLSRVDLPIRGIEYFATFINPGTATFRRLFRVAEDRQKRLRFLT